MSKTSDIPYAVIDREPIVLPKYMVDELLEIKSIRKRDAYEIITTISNENNTAHGSGKIMSFEGDQHDWNNKYWDIHSVKRLSDGVVFTLGDKMLRSEKYNVVNTIKKFTLKNDPILEGDAKIIVDFGENPTNFTEMYGFNRFVELYELKPYKEEEPLFTTEDGVEIYEGDVCWYCDFQLRDLQQVDWSLGHPFDNMIYFSTKDVGRQYIADHTPRYSNADIERALKVFTGNAQFHKQKFKDELKK